MRKFKGDTPKSARIRIDYRVKKPRVKFSYPSKNSQYEGSMFPFIFIGWVFIVILGVMGYAMVLDVEKFIENYSPANETAINSSEIMCKEKIDNYLEENYTQLIETVCGTNEEKYFSKEILQELKEGLPVALLIILLLVSPPFLIYYPFKKFWANVYPEWVALVERKKIKKFRTLDAQLDKDNRWYCELPVFNNVILDYKATSDFSKYLEEFEIEEHKFTYYKAKRKKAKMVKGKYKRPKTVNEYLWYARFYFSRKPLKGGLEVMFK